MQNAKYLTENALEKRIRRTLAKHGQVLHKLRDKQGYIVYDADDPDENGYFYSFDRLVDYVEYLREREAS